MAVLTDTDRKDAWAEIMRELSAASEPCSINKVDLRAAIDAIDAWVDANASSFNTAIPQPARSALTAKQKSRILLHVVNRRFKVS